MPKISQFPSGGAAQNTDLIPVVRNGGDYTVTAYNFAALASYGQAYVGTFTATAGQTVFTLPASPGSLANLAISVDGAVMVPGTDYTWTTPTTLTFTTGLSNGQTVLYRYTTSVPVGTAIAGGVNGQLLYNNSGIVNGTTIGGDATLVATTGALTVTKTNGVAFAASATTNTTVTGNITYTQGGTGATSRTVTSKLQESVSVKDFGVTGSGSDESAAMQAAFNALGPGVRLNLCGLSISIGSRLTISSISNFTIDGEGATITALSSMPITSNNQMIAVTSCTDFTIENLNLNGNRFGRGTANLAIHNLDTISCQRFIYRMIRSLNAPCYGFQFTTSTNTVVSSYCTDFRIENCVADNAYSNGLSVINAYHFVISGCTFTNTTGTAPQAGIDIESNSGATLGNTHGIVENCRFESNAGPGIQFSNVSGSENFTVRGCYFNANGTMAASIFANDVHIENCTITGHTTAAVGLVYFGASSTIVGGSVSGCDFRGNTNSTACIASHSLTSGVRVFANTIENQSAGTGIATAGTGHVVHANAIYSCAGIGITGLGIDCVYSSNYVKACTGRGIYQVSGAANRTRIVDNTVQDIATVSGGYIQNDDNGTVIRGNTLVSSTSATTTIGIYLGNSSTGSIVTENTFNNLHATQPIGFGGTSVQANSIYSNIGGTANDARGMLSGMALPQYTTGGRPSSPYVGQCVYDTTLGYPVWYTGSVWHNAAGATV